MKKVVFVAIIAFSILNSQFSTVTAQNLVPQPVSVVHGEGGFAVDTFLAIEYSAPELGPLADYLRGMVDGGRFSLAIDAGLTDGEGRRLPDEGYVLDVQRDRTYITGRDYNGVWNGVQTYLQLLPAPPVVTVTDYPSMPFRGVMLDVARTFVPADEVMRIIDNLARQKINKFHWHLTDNEAWRVEIEKYPFLTEVGAFRGGDSKIFAVYGHWDRKFGGYYSKKDISRIVEFARVRGVEIIPEIDLPGHSRAAAIAYPSILCDYSPDLSASQGYDTRDVWCAAREENYEMLDGIIGEIAAMFPSEYIHLGGDEVNSSQWAKCPHCQALMARHGFTDPKRLEDIFMARVIDIAARHGKKAAVWNEAAARGEIPRSTVVFGWENVSAARRSALNGYPTVVCPGEYFYFDMKQGPTDPGHTWAGIVTAEKVYSFDLENVSRVRDGATENASEEDLPEVPAGVVSPAGSGLPTSGAIGVEATFFSELGLENGSGGAREGVSGASERAHNRASAGAVGASIGAYSGAGGAAAGATKSVHTSTDDEVRFFGVEARKIIPKR